MRALVIEDDKQMATFVHAVLAEPGSVVDVAHTGAEARPLLAGPAYDIVLLDLLLPDASGAEILIELRNGGGTVPVLVLTGHGDESDVVRLLDAGADDYLVKPVSPEVLRARVRALLRRMSALRSEESLALGSLLLNRVTHRVFDGAKELSLTPREFSLLQHFMLRAGKVVSRSELLAQVWEMDFEPGSNVIDANVARLRKKLECCEDAPVLSTVRGVGFRLES